jgi:alginate O-acetyltransferase complex protein AlgF
MKVALKFCQVSLRRGMLGMLITMCTFSMAAGPKLYESGPGEDAAYVRFVNATGQPIDVLAAGKNAGRMHIDNAHPASAFLPLRPKSLIAGRISQGNATADINATAAPGELVTVVVWSKAGQALETTVLAELPKDFNALKATLAFYNFDSQCPAAGLTAGGRDTVIVEGTGPLSVKRRTVNPVALSTQPTCGAARIGPALDLKTLEAGQRYSIFLAPGPQGRRAFWVKDEL